MINLHERMLPTSAGVEPATFFIKCSTESVYEQQCNFPYYLLSLRLRRGYCYRLRPSVRYAISSQTAGQNPTKFGEWLAYTSGACKSAFIFVPAPRGLPGSISIANLIYMIYDIILWRLFCARKNGFKSPVVYYCPFRGGSSVSVLFFRSSMVLYVAFLLSLFVISSSFVVSERMHFVLVTV